MNQSKPIILIEDDADDIEIIRTAVQLLDIPNPIVVFTDGAKFVRHLSDPEVDPLMVISDVNLPAKHGVELYKELKAIPEFVAKKVPYVFLSTSPEYAVMASEISGCGYFVKPRNYLDYVSIVQHIVLYWIKAESKGR